MAQWPSIVATDSTYRVCTWCCGDENSREEGGEGAEPEPSDSLVPARGEDRVKFQPIWSLTRVSIEAKPEPDECEFEG